MSLQLQSTRRTIVVSVLGLLLVFGSVQLLLWDKRKDGVGRNSGSITSKIEIIRKKSEIRKNRGKLVALEGRAISAHRVTDRKFLKTSYKSLGLRRIVQMYAWNRNPKSGRYYRDWSTSPKVGGPKRYRNPKKKLLNYGFQPKVIQVDGHKLGTRKLNIEGARDLKITKRQIRHGKVAGKWIYLNKRVRKPRIGDLRIRYKVIPNLKSATLFGKSNGKTIVPYRTKDQSLFDLFPGRAEAGIDRLGLGGSLLDNLSKGWLVRLIGAIALFAGLATFILSLSSMGHQIPWIGKYLRHLGRRQSYLSAVTLSLVTFIGIVFSWAYILAPLAIGGIGFLGHHFYKKRKTSAPAIAEPPKFTDPALSAIEELPSSPLRLAELEQTSDQITSVDDEITPIAGLGVSIEKIEDSGLEVESSAFEKPPVFTNPGPNPGPNPEPRIGPPKKEIPGATEINMPPQQTEFAPPPPKPEPRQQREAIPPQFDQPAQDSALIPLGRVKKKKKSFNPFRKTG